MLSFKVLLTITAVIMVITTAIGTFTFHNLFLGLLCMIWCGITPYLIIYITNDKVDWFSPYRMEESK